MTIEEILEIENVAFPEGEAKYGDFFINAISFYNLLNGFIKEVDPDAFLFVMFLGQVKKYNLLALLSVLRQHHVQGMLDMRQMLEAGTNAAYGLANPDPAHFVVTEKDGTLSAPQPLITKRYKWLDQNYPAGSGAIKRLKENINSSCAHSNLIYVFNNFEMKKEGFELSYFDKDDEYLVKTDLWFIGNVTMGLLDLFNGVNKNAKHVKLIDGFEKELLELERENQKLKTEMSQHPRYIAAMERNAQS